MSTHIPTNPSLAERGPLDPNAVEGLRTLEPLRGETGLVDIFIRNSTRRIESLREAVDNRDLGEVMALAHTLRGSAATIGACLMAECCSQIEAHARAGDPDAVRTELRRLVSETTTAYAALEAVFPS